MKLESSPDTSEDERTPMNVASSEDFRGNSSEIPIVSFDRDNRESSSKGD